MQVDELLDCAVLDCHIHYPHPQLMPGLIKTCDALKIERFNVVCTPHQQRLSLVPDALHLKAHYPGRVSVFGGLDISTYFREPQRVGEALAGFVDFLFAAGCDGIKMIEGKPDMRRMLPVPPFDSEVFAPYWQKMAQLQMPVLMHVNDPEEFWDARRIPAWAVKRGWFYGDGSYIDNEKQYEEIYNMLEDTPGLKVIFAHFFFFSAQLPRLSDLLERFPNVSIDLTPGIEMYHNFSGNLQETRDFFLRYQDRILFGTDIGARALLIDPSEGISVAESRQRVLLVRNFLENDGEFFLEAGSGFLFGDAHFPFRGLGLSLEVLEKIYFKNFEALAGKTPRPINPGLVVEMCNQIEQMIALQGSSQPGVPGDVSVVQSVRSYFQSLT